MYKQKKSVAIRNTFKAYERLKREQHIDTLFRKGKAFSVFPLKIIYLQAERNKEELSPVRVGFSIPKKKFKKAVNRNRVKRLLREAWRLNKAIIYEQVPMNHQLHVFAIFTGMEISSFAEINEAMKQAMKRLIRELNH